jgi:DnaJ-class molecular chaperone
MDPYATLGVSASVSDAELRAAYRRAVQRHHPDHNGGSAESALRFEEVQEAYAQIRAKRTGVRATVGGGASAGGGAGSGATDLRSRLAQMERELAAARAAREHAQREARATREREQAKARALRDAREAAAGPRRPSDEELGYFKTDDSFSKILGDAASRLTDRLSDARQHGVGKNISDLIDELGEKLTGER